MPLAGLFRMLHGLLHILAQRVLVHVEEERGAARRQRDAQVGVAAARAREQQQVRDAQRARHGDVVLQLVRPPFLHSRRPANATRVSLCSLPPFSPVFGK